MAAARLNIVSCASALSPEMHEQAYVRVFEPSHSVWSAFRARACVRICARARARAREAEYVWRMLAEL